VDERPDCLHLSYDRMASLLAFYENLDALAIADDNTHSDQAHCGSDHIPTTWALAFDQPQPGEGDGDVDAAISGIGVSRRPRMQAQEPCEGGEASCRRQEQPR
jgi:hypothetical protein